MGKCLISSLWYFCLCTLRRLFLGANSLKTLWRTRPDYFLTCIRVNLLINLRKVLRFLPSGLIKFLVPILNNSLAFNHCLAFTLVVFLLLPFPLWTLRRNNAWLVLCLYIRDETILKCKYRVILPYDYLAIRPSRLYNHEASVKKTKNHFLLLFLEDPGNTIIW